MDSSPNASRSLSVSASIDVLYIEDDRDFAARVASQLERERGRFTVHTESDPRVALDRIRRGDAAFDCVVCDYDMPELDGLDVLSRVRDEFPKLPFILFTERAREEIAGEALSAGATDYLRKGDDATQYRLLATRIENAVELARAIRTPRSEPLETRLSVRERAMDEAPIGIVLTDPHAADNPIVYANEQFTELTGYSRDEAVGRNCRFLQGEATDEAAVDELRAAVEEREPVTTELLNYRKDGSEFWNRVRVAPIFDDDGVIDFFVGFQDDITPRKTYEGLLRSNTARLEALFEHSPDLVVVHEDDGTIQDVNQRMFEELGYSESELVGKTVWDLDPTSEQDRSESFWADLPANEPQRFEGALERRDGTTFPTEVHLIQLNLAGEDLFVAMIRDISDQKAREAELVEQNERLDRFTSVVSHDLRNPLQVAMGRLELVQDECASEHLDDIDRALDRMDDLISDLLVLARDGDDAMTVEPVALSDLARTCWQNVVTDGATLAVETDTVVDVDRDQLQQLLENLFRNAVEHGSTGSRSSSDDAVEHGSTGNQTASGDAVEHGSTGSRTPSDDAAEHGSADGGVTVTVGETDRGFFVEDDGVGIPAEDRDTVFEAGYTTSPQGTGFGLNIVSQVAATHGWEVTVSEGSAGGSRFEFRID
ncbi:PAS domain S-box protein [Haloferax chudinovii]|mgnify:CR=1 FL=1|uniref:histidine kinase n=1 Tax=Haloferax chudinovii TaxID=1109010 RepID=A0ABD5XHP9_9EURY